MANIKRKCANGDTLEFLNKQMVAANAEVERTRKRLNEEKARLMRFEKEAEVADMFRMNIATRQNIWWQEMRRRDAQVKNRKPRKKKVEEQIMAPRRRKFGVE